MNPPPAPGTAEWIADNIAVKDPRWRAALLALTLLGLAVLFLFA
jgi:hypothetical protein